MPDERLEVSVTFDERGYIGSAPELRSAVTALSLGGLRRKIEALLLPTRSRSCCSSTASPSRSGTGGRRRRSLTNGLPSRTNVCTRRKRTCGPQAGSPGLTDTAEKGF